jgi:2-(1,2-epoxy-1,2-dihydrophenyl)acetyl-CoA isomerase
MEQVLLETLEDGVFTLTLNRPERLNTFTPELLQLLDAALARAAVDREIGVIVLRGAGRGFCAGGDVKAMAEGVARQASYDERVQNLRRRVRWPAISASPATRSA